MDEPRALPTKLLFVCSRNRLRSLTAERIFGGIPGYQVRSAGTQPEARIVVTAGHIGWADLIFVMEKSHLNQMRRRFPEAMEGKPVVTLLIPDHYEYMQPELIDELLAKVAGHIDLPET
jgi:predicted protein tyrosine phosphatase